MSTSPPATQPASNAHGNQLRSPADPDGNPTRSATSATHRHRARGGLRHLTAIASTGSRAAVSVALERNAGQRLRRIVDVAGDRVGERRRPTRPLMRALVIGPGARIGWRNVPQPPDPGPGGAMVQPVAMATCDMDRPLGLGATPFPLPVHLGHECVARVVSVGEQVHAVSPGDLVVVPFQISCGQCLACRNQQSGNCRSVPPLSMYGFGVAGGLWGGVIADRIAVPCADAMLVPLPAGVDPAAVASASDTLTDAYRHIAPHVDRVRTSPDGPRVLLVGAVRERSLFSASVPLYAGLIARALLPEADVHLVDARPAVRAYAEQLGLSAGPPTSLRGRSAPLVVDSSAHPRGLAAALRATAPDGHCSCAGTLHGRATVPAARMFGRNVTLSIARSHVRAALPGLLDLVANRRLRPELVTTTTASYADGLAALREHLLGPDIKTVLIRTP